MADLTFRQTVINALIFSCVFHFSLYFFNLIQVKQQNIATTDRGEYVLEMAIGVVSARENFELRKAARSTWLKEYLPYKNNIAKAWFIVGQECSIPPEYRQSKFGCSKWTIDLNGLSETFHTSHENVPKICSQKYTKTLYQGFSFKVYHPVVVKRLGVLSDILMPDVEVTVAVLNIQTKEVIVDAKIIQNASYIKDGYMYGDVETVLFPKDFEGMVLVEGYLRSETCSQVLWDNGGGIIMFNQLYTSDSHLDSVRFTNESVSAASIEFYVDDMKYLKSKIVDEQKVTTEWMTKLEKINQKLLRESQLSKDIVVVNVTDTYRNLPAKLLEFYVWLYTNQTFSSAMKTDDDSMVDIPNLLFEIRKKDSEISTDEFWLWSRFRRDWPVNYVGKWADFDYRSSLYPAFPCGAAYVMSASIVKWLYYNSRLLFPYQGEDVSMGIWLSAIKPKLIDDSNFECDTKCSDKSHNRAQLSPSEIYDTWTLYKKCKNLCSCS